MKKSFIFIFAFLFSISIFAEVNKCHNALSNHIREAISHNQSMVQNYARLSENESIRWSYGLITLESLSLPLTYILDKKADVYHKKNVNVLCDEIVSMKDLPTFKGPWTKELRPIEFHNLDISIIAQTIRGLTINKSFMESYQFIDHQLVELENYPHQLCLTRHFLESMARTLWIKESHEQAAQIAHLESPEFIILDFLKIQIDSLKTAYYFDKHVFGLESKMGVPIYCDDVPKIKWK